MCGFLNSCMVAGELSIVCVCLVCECLVSGVCARVRECVCVSACRVHLLPCVIASLLIALVSEPELLEAAVLKYCPETEKE